MTLHVFSLYKTIPHEFGLEALDYFLTKYQEDLHPRFKKELELQQENQKVQNCGKSWVSCPFLLASLYHFRQVNKTFILKNSLKCQSSNLIYFGIFQGCNKNI